MGEVAVLNFANSVNLGGGGNMGLDRLATIQNSWQNCLIRRCADLIVNSMR